MSLRWGGHSGRRRSHDRDCAKDRNPGGINLQLQLNGQCEGELEAETQAVGTLGIPAGRGRPEKPIEGQIPSYQEQLHGCTAVKRCGSSDLMSSKGPCVKGLVPMVTFLGMVGPSWPQLPRRSLSHWRRSENPNSILSCILAMS